MANKKINEIVFKQRGEVRTQGPILYLTSRKKIQDRIYDPEKEEKSHSLIHSHTHVNKP